MPIDPSIPLGATVPKFENPLSLFANVMQIRNAYQQVQGEQLKLESARRSAADDQALRLAVKSRSTSGAIDWDGVASDLDSGGFAPVAFKVREAVIEQRTKLATTIKTESENALRPLTMASQIAQGITDEGSFQRARRAISAILGPGVSAHLGETYDPARVKEAVAWGRTATEHTAAQRNAADFALNAMRLAQDAARDATTAASNLPKIEEEWRKSLGTAAQGFTSQADLDKARAYYSEFGEIPRRLINQYLPEGSKYDSATVSRLVGLAISPEKKADLADSAADRAARASEGREDRAIRIRGLDLQGAVVGEKRNDALDIAAAIQSGDQPPDLSRLYGLAGTVRAELARKDYDLTQAQADWQSVSAYLRSANAAPQLRLRQAVDFTQESLGLVRDLSKEWGSSGLGPLSRARLRLATQGALGQEAQSLATRLEAQIADVTSELANVYRGGYAPTNEAIRLAATNLQSDWSAKTLEQNLAQIEKNLQYRRNSLITAGAVGLSSTNRYAPERAPGAVVAPTPADVADALASMPARSTPYNLDNGTSWIKNADGSIVPAP